MSQQSLLPFHAVYLAHNRAYAHEESERGNKSCQQDDIALDGSGSVDNRYGVWKAHAKLSLVGTWHETYSVKERATSLKCPKGGHEKFTEEIHGQYVQCRTDGQYIQCRTDQQDVLFRTNRPDIQSRMEWKNVKIWLQPCECFNLHIR